MAKGKRKTIILNPDNPKEKLILELLEKQYNASEFIKDLLFNYILNNNILHDNNTMITPLPYNDNLMTNALSHDDNCITTPLSHDDNCITTPLSHHDNAMTTSLSHDDNSNFLIDLNNISDADANINAVPEDPNKNALDFLKNF